jgi:tRNA A-37 threonylcarbamoyl transferase component Bud32
MKLIINHKYQEHESFVKDLEKKFNSAGETIKHGRNTIKTFNVGDHILNVKAFKIPHLINKFAYKYFRGSKAEHSFEYGIKLNNLGVNTPEPIAYLETSRLGLFYKSFYISMQHVYDFTIRDLIGFDFPDKENILKQFAVFTYEKLHKNGVHHLDYSRGNILITRLENQQYDFSIVDINRMKFEKMDYIKGLKNFAQIWANEDELEIVARKYAQINNKNEEEAIKLLIQFDKQHKEKIERKKRFKKMLKSSK